MSTHTPWGQAQTSRQITRGIMHYTTAGHGGFVLSPGMKAKMPEPIKSIETFAGGNAYEEDCDWALVALAFPEHFDPETILLAYETAKRYHTKHFDVDDYIQNHTTGQACRSKGNIQVQI